MLLTCLPLQGLAQIHSKPDHIAAIKKLTEEERWGEVTDRVESIPDRGAEIYYYYAIALAQLGRWDEARTAFVAGLLLRPNDARFSIELGGVAFRQKRYSEAVHWLRRGLRLDPNNPYANDFLATVYFLEHNLEAALKYWDRVDKPQIENVRVEPKLQVDPVLLDRAFAFAPASKLRLRDLLTTETRISGLGIFPTYRFRLDARDDGRFDAAFEAQERNGWGNSKAEALLSTFRGIFYHTIYPEYFNLGRSATNISSLVRWDPQKRRVMVSLSGPPRQNPKYRYQIGLDLRNENWELRQSPQTPAPTLGALNLRRAAVNGGFTSLNSGRWDWSVGAEFSYRDYRNVLAGPALPPDVLWKGYQLKQLARLNYVWARVPERRFESKASISSETGTIWSAPAHSFEKVQASVDSVWHPQMSGDDYAMRAQIRTGKTIGTVPFDELFMLGLERDNNLWMRAHVATRDGHKGSAPLGRNYFLSNSEIDKNIYQNGFLRVKLSPFLDIGKSSDPSLGLGSKQWLWDMGVQVKFRVLGVGIMFIYGKDLRSGKNAFYIQAER